MPRTATVLALVLATLALVAPAAANAAAGDQAVAYQLDPGHDGASDVAIAAPLSKIWSIALPGAISYPLIADGIVYVTAQAASGEGATLYAIQQSSGTTLWSHALGGDHGFAGLAYDAGQVFTVNYNGTLTAFDALSGATNWSIALPGQSSFTSPPTAADGFVYTAGSGEGGTLYAVAQDSGALAWTAAVAGGDHSSPAVDASGVYVTYGGGQDYAFDPASGAALWQSDSGIEGAGGTTPVLAGGDLFTRDATTGNAILAEGSGAALGSYASTTAPAVSGGVAYTLGDGALVAVGDGGLGAGEWTFTGDGGLDTAPLAVGGLVFEGSSIGDIYAIDASTGASVWSANVGSAINAPDERDAVTLTGLGAAEGTLIVPAGDMLFAFAGAGATGAPADTLAPTITGTPSVGQALGADVGTWTGLPSGYSYQWLRCDPSGSNCAAIAGATGESYAPLAADGGSTLELSVVASNGEGSSAPVSSAPTAIVTAPPSARSAPTITGTAQVGQTLSAQPGGWLPSPTSVAYQWLACYDGSCRTEVGATASSYRVDYLDAGFHLEVRVSVANAAGNATAYSAATAAVTPAASPGPAAQQATVTLRWTLAPQVSGRAAVGSTLTATTGLVNAFATYAYQWQSCPAAGPCTDIAGAQGATFRPTAALVGSTLRALVTATVAGSASSEPSNRSAAVTQTKGVAAAVSLSRSHVDLVTVPGVAAFIHDGLRAKARCAKACEVSVALVASGGEGALAGTIGSTRARLKAGQARTLTIVPGGRARAAIAARRTVRLELRVRIVEAGATRSYDEAVTIGR